MPLENVPEAGEKDTVMPITYTLVIRSGVMRFWYV